MSMELLVGLPAGATMTGETVSAAAGRLGLELSFDEDFALDDVGGFQPGRIAGLRAGIEISAYEGDDLAEFLEFFGPHAEKLERVVAMYWGASFAEGAFAYAVAAALVASCQGICFDPQEDELLSLERALQGAQGLLEEARKQPTD